MTFEEKKLLIDTARANYLSFDDYFKELLGSGMSNSGVYSMIPLEEIEKHETINELNLWNTATASVRDSSPIRLRNHSIVKKLETLNEQSSKLK